MAQSFYPITPTEVTPATANAWTDVDVSGSVPSGATGVILHIVNKSTDTVLAISVRKNGSTDNRTQTTHYIHHWWGAIGIDANRIFEAYVGSTTDIDIYLVGYTISGVTFLTNATDKSLGTAGSWLDIDCSTEAPSAVGLIWEVTGTANENFNFRKNGSTDNRIDGGVYRHMWAMVGCDASQICEGWIQTTDVDFFLVGYVTDGATFKTNADDKSLGTIDTWLDIDCSTEAPSAAMLFFEVQRPTAAGYYGLRKNGSAEDIYYYCRQHASAFVECDTSQIVEGKIGATEVDFFLVGYAEAAAVGWTHSFLGVANANIGNIMGVAKANIGNVSGVA